MNKKRVIRRAAAGGCIIIVLCAIFFLRPKAGELAVVNDAGESVLKAGVEINGAKFELANLPPGAVRKLKYNLKADNHFTVSVEFRYDRKLGRQDGYFTGKVKETHRLVIKHNEVVLESGGD